MSNKHNLVVCGDSFNVGIGLVDMEKQRYGQLVANKLDYGLTVLARGSASNYAVFLQGVFASTMTPKPKCVILSVTSYDRIEWLADELQDHITPELINLNYHQYPPHHHPQPHHSEPLDFYLKSHPEYNPKLLTEQVVAISDYIGLLKKKQPGEYYERLHSQSKEKLEMLLEHYLTVWGNNTIKYDYDRGLILSAYTRIKNNGIPYLVLSQDHAFSELIPNDDLISHDWGELSRKYPDSIGSLHADYPAHEYTADLILERMVANRYV
jgi:hypothetical protein